MDAHPRVVRLSGEQVRALAHPLRSRLLAQLRLDGPATATRLAATFGTNTGATSYHLRQLAAAGLVAEDAGAGRGRERWWRAEHDISSFFPSDYDDDPDAAAAVRWLDANAVRRFADHARRWAETAPTWPRQWRDAASGSDYILSLDAARLRALVDELGEVVARHRAAADAAPATDDTRQVLLYLHAFPRQGDA
ncbi:ArsR/SmtB family transcription factor [Spirilliplanes yamanashiensis]|uniref:Transcriptional regulator n=1 Tax=Spirilliplanes yamanashiensis TaxID=42233 RepID=A0A8J3YBZ6_9ACTN|nr:helix-turn-helix domain-containing protein [Spirilliplanes yamanashiensis]MDP9818636.1 putative ArsR family transcriptional regulator [Spirilliplanes yamanashiensis]GIJ05092.1 transcriptional regulator [Spirilliplanes yamanashiensis]